MEIRTRIELIHSACPNCGEANFGGDNYCRSCGALLITQNVLMDGASEEDIKELATAHKAAIVSKVLPARRITIDIILLVLVVPALTGLFTLALASKDAVGSFPKTEAVIYLLITLPIYCTILYLAAAGPVNKYKAVIKEGTQYPAVVIGNSYGMLHEKTASNTNGRSIYPCIKVVAKINGADTTVVLYAPDGITEQNCPIGTELIITGHDDKFVIDPQSRIEIIEKYVSGKTQNIA
ncbi:MAG: hypothetical protein J5643_03765 [Lachnospiraceae bacterium]|nr:hypothetical protein [Lachnospiraceae bacterium]